MRRCWLGVLAVMALLAAGCGDDVGEGGGDVCSRDDVDGCSLLGLVFDEPRPLDEALRIAEGFGGVAIAVYRTDAVCVSEVSFTAVPPEPPGRTASRIAYVDAEEISERRLAATNSGLSPPITGLHISQSYWDQWEEEWRLAQRDGVLIAAVALYTAEANAEMIGEHSEIAAVVVVPSRRTDSLDPSYPGELFVEYKSFPPGYLEPVPLIDC